MENFDLIVIGGGPGGYVAAIAAAQSGLKVACIDKRKNLGGTCLNVGCIPSKRLLYSSELFKNVSEEMHHHGIEVNTPKFNLSQMMKGKEEAISKLTNGVEFLFKKNKVQHIVGLGFIEKGNEVKVNKKKYKATNIIIASGSYPTQLKNIDIDENIIVSSTGALSFKKVPKKLAVIGAGYIGLELGSVWNRLGSEVTVIEYANSIVPSMDADIGNTFRNELQKQGINFLLSSEVTKAKIKNDEVHIDINSGAGIETSKKGHIAVNQFYETSAKNIYAIGDVIEGPMLAHKASMEAQAVIDIILGKNGQVNYDAIPSVVYTSPEVAWVGKTQSKVTGNTTGMIKVYSHTESDKILGAHIIGNHAGEMIGEFVVAIEMGATAEDIALICHAHPTLSESIKEAASLASFGQTIHS